MMQCIVFLWMVLTLLTDVSDGIVPPGAVGSLSVRLQQQTNTLTLNWTAPSVPVNESADNLTYCVQVVEASTASMLHSECAIDVTEFQYPSSSPRIHCHIFTFTVIPVNSAGNGTERVESYINGTSSEVIAIQPRLSHESGAPIVVYELNMTAPICSGRVLLEDIHTSEKVLLNITATTVFTFSSEQLTQNRRYNVSVTANNSAGSFLSFTTLSTHDITGFRFIKQANKTRVLVSYSSISPATVGALITFVFISNDSVVNLTRSTLLALDRSASQNYSLPFQLYTGVYQVFLYDIDQSSTLATGVAYPAITENVSVTGASQGFSRPLNTDRCTVISSQLSIAANCMYPSSITSFQLIAQLMHPKKVHRLFVNTSSRMSAVTVAVEEYGLYQVSIFFVRQNGILGSGTADFSTAHLVQPLNGDPTTMSSTTEAEESSEGMFFFDYTIQKQHHGHLTEASSGVSGRLWKEQKNMPADKHYRADLLRILPFVFSGFIVVGVGGTKFLYMYIKYRKVRRQQRNAPAHIVVPARSPHAEVVDQAAESPPTYTANYHNDVSEQQHSERLSGGDNLQQDRQTDN